MRTSHYLQNIATQVDVVDGDWKVYKDEGVSGRIFFADRPAGKRMLEDVAKGKIKEVVVLRLDRLGRDTADLLTTIRTLHSHGVSICSKSEGIRTLIDGKESAMTNLLVNILSSLAEWQYHQTREKTLNGVALAKAQNRYQGRKLGSVESQEKFATKPKVKKIKELLDAGVGIRKICRTLECSANYVYKIRQITENRVA